MSLELQLQKSQHPVIIRVDDDEHVTYLLDFLLERHGYIVVKARDGQDFLELLENGPPPSLVLLDIMLPYVDGFELVKRIRQHHRWKDTPVMILSSLENEKDIVHGFDAGANDYITKPFQPMELIARIRRLLGSEYEADPQAG